jgi:hypothetical protein
MLDKILFVNENKVVIYFENRNIEVTTDNGTAFKLAMMTLGEDVEMNEDTQIIDLDKVA